MSFNGASFLSEGPDPRLFRAAVVIISVFSIHSNRSLVKILPPLDLRLIPDPRLNSDTLPFSLFRLIPEQTVIVDIIVLLLMRVGLSLSLDLWTGKSFWEHTLESSTSSTIGFMFISCLWGRTVIVMGLSGDVLPPYDWRSDRDSMHLFRARLSVKECGIPMGLTLIIWGLIIRSLFKTVSNKSLVSSDVARTSRPFKGHGAV